MPRKPRRFKTEMQLWVMDNRKRLSLTPLDLARATGVSEDTARGWESRGRPSEESLTVLEELFDRQSPRDEEPQDGQVAMLGVLTRIAEALERLAPPDPAVPRVTGGAERAVQQEVGPARTSRPSVHQVGDAP